MLFTKLQIQIFYKKMFEDKKTIYKFIIKEKLIKKR